MAARSAIKSQPKSTGEITKAILKSTSFETIDLSEAAFQQVTKELEETYSTDDETIFTDSDTGSRSYSSDNDGDDVSATDSDDEESDSDQEAKAPQISLTNHKSLHDLALVCDSQLKDTKEVPVVDKHGLLVDDLDRKEEAVLDELGMELEDEDKTEYIPVPPELTELEKKRQFKVASEPSCFFRDGKRKIDYILVFDTKSGFGRLLNEKHLSIRKAFEIKLQEQGLELEYEESQEKRVGRVAYVKVHATWEFLTLAAEFLNCEMPIKKFDLDKKRHRLQAKIKRAATCNNRLNNIFQIPEESRRPPVQRFYNMPYERELEDCFIIEDKESFFTPVQRIRLVAYAIQRITIDISGNGKVSISLPEMVRTGIYTAEYPLHDSDCTDPDLKYENQPVEYVPLRLWLTRNWGCMKAWRYAQPLNDIWSYFGEKIALYFAWMGVYTAMLVPAAIAGLISVVIGVSQIFLDDSMVQICNEQVSEQYICRACQEKNCPYTFFGDHCGFAKIATVFDNFLTPIFAFFISLWGVVFLNVWKRKQATLAANWDSMEDEDSRGDLLRPEFRSKMKKSRLNPVTRKEELYMSSQERNLRVILSTSILVVVYSGLIASFFGLNMFRRLATATLNDSKSSFVQLFGADILASLSASCINLLMIFVLSAMFSRLAWWLTHIECPRTEEQFEESFIYKRTLFEFVNNYGMLLYLALLKGKVFTTPDKQTSYIDQCSPIGCMAEVSLQLMVILCGKQLIDNLLIEASWPSFKIWFRENFFTKSKAEKTKRPRWEKDEKLEPLEQIAVDDYLEMVIQYGFITMFAAAFPLAPLFSILNNIVEIRIDASKYIVESRRPVPHRADDIGPFLPILEVFTKLAVITNAAVIAFTSNFLEKAVYVSIRSYSNLLRLSNGFFPEFVANKNTSLAGFRQWSMSIFITEDYKVPGLMDGLIENVAHNVTYCFFPGYYQTDLNRIGSNKDIAIFLGSDVLDDYNNGNGTWGTGNKTNTFAPSDTREFADSNYYLRPEWWILMAFRLVFIIVFEHLIIALQEVIEVLVPDTPADVGLFEHREAFVRAQVLTRFRSWKKESKKQMESDAEEKNSESEDEYSLITGTQRKPLDPTKTVFGGRTGGQYKGGDIFTQAIPDVGEVEDKPSLGKRLIRRVLCCFPFLMYGDSRVHSESSYRGGNVYSSVMRSFAQNGFATSKY